VTRPLVLCLLGTDHHPFARLVSWCDDLQAARPDVEVLVQHGSTAGPTRATGQDFLDKQTLTSSLERAHVAVCHGGPGLISDLRGAGLFPLVVARDPDLGEHVDGHQMRFVARVAASGIVRSMASYDELQATVEQMLVSDRGSGLDPSEDRARVAASVARFADAVEPLRRGR
jgi:UDP-N-acetylglucosamine transferase subunit ALG13